MRGNAGLRGRKKIAIYWNAYKNHEILGYELLSKEKARIQANNYPNFGECEPPPRLYDRTHKT